jgi:hypothetical protein
LIVAASASWRAAPDVEPASSAYERYAGVFSRAYADVHSIALALEIVDTYRAREALTRPVDLGRPERVLAVAASLFDVPARRLLERNRRSDVTAARYVAAWIFRRRRWALTKIAEFLCLDHSTIVHGLRKVAATSHLLLAALKAEQLLEAEVPPIARDLLRR